MTLLKRKTLKNDNSEQEKYETEVLERKTLKTDCSKQEESEKGKSGNAAFEKWQFLTGKLFKRTTLERGILNKIQLWTWKLWKITILNRKNLNSYNTRTENFEDLTILNRKIWKGSNGKENSGKGQFWTGRI